MPGERRPEVPSYRKDRCMDAAAGSVQGGTALIWVAMLEIGAVGMIVAAVVIAIRRDRRGK